MKQYTNHTSTLGKGKGINLESRDFMRKKIKWGKKIKWTAIAVGVLAILFIGNYVYSIVNTVSHFNKPKGTSIFDAVKPLIPDPQLEPPKWEGTQRVNILVLGGDERGLSTSGHEVPRSDSMMVVSIEPNTKKALLISILRDTYVKIPGHGSDRINAALALGGPNLAMKTVSDLLDIPIQYYVYMGFKGFIGVIDAVNGVEIDVEKDMDWVDNEDDNIYDIHLKKGLQKMDGKTALQYVRFRHDPLSDFARSERQRKFLTAISEQIQSASGILQMPKILKAIEPNIETNISLSDMLKLGALGFDAKASGFVGIQVPPSHLLDERRINGAAVLTTDSKLLQSYIQDKFIESLTGVEQPLAHMQPSPTEKPISRSTPKPVETTKPIIDPSPTATPAIPTESANPGAESQPPNESATPTPIPTIIVSPTATPVPTPTPKATDAPKATPTGKPVIKVQ
jgi:LCP family protein required for cell wall assembly